MRPRTPIFGILAEFDKPQEILAATRRAREAGYRAMDAYTPYPVEGLAEELGLRRTRVPSLVLTGGIVGAVAGYLMQYWMMAVDYPLDVGGKPLNSWPAFLPVTFEVAILIAGLSALVGMLLLNGLPQPYHPIFNVPRFVDASHERFFLGIEATDASFDADQTRAFLMSLSPARVMDIPHYEEARAPEIAAASAHPPKAAGGADMKLTSIAAIWLALLSGCQQQMAVSPGYRVDQSSRFFADGRANRPLVEGAIARGHLRLDADGGTGDRPQGEASVRDAAGLIGAGAADPRQAASWAAVQYDASRDKIAENIFPFEVTETVLLWGRDRYMIFCVVCHDATGTGRGTIVERGYTPPPSYHIERLRNAPVGHYFKVVTLGYGSMPSYRNQIRPRDRWAIVAYVRALQLSQHYPVDELTADMKRDWQRQDKGGAP